MPFSHVERPVRVPRPALVVSRVPIGPAAAHVRTPMIADREREAWPGAVPIEEVERHGRIIPSKVRTSKVAISEIAPCTPIGRRDPATMARVMEQVGAICA